METILNYTEKMGGLKIDRRTYAGKRLVETIKEHSIEEINKVAKEWDLHPALTFLRVKDVNNWIRDNNINQN